LVRPSGCVLCNVDVVVSAFASQSGNFSLILSLILTEVPCLLASVVANVKCILQSIYLLEMKPLSQFCPVFRRAGLPLPYLLCHTASVTGRLLFLLCKLRRWRAPSANIICKIFRIFLFVYPASERFWCTIFGSCFFRHLL